MTTKTFSQAMGDIDARYIERAMSYGAKTTSISHVKRRLSLPLVAAMAAILLIGSAVAAVILYGDLWIQKPSSDPTQSVRSALENQVGKDYTIQIEVKSVEIDEEETARAVEWYLTSFIAERNHWSEEYLTEHFLAVKAVYDAEYDHTQTTRSDGEVIMYFYLTQDVRSGEWTIVDNSGNMSLAEKEPAAEDSDLPVKTTEEQIFSYLSELFNEAYSPYYDGLRYEMRNYTETTDENEVTSTFLWTMHFLGKRWDVPSDEGVEQEANLFLQATATVNEEGVLDPETISVLADESAVGPPDFSTPIEAFFPS